MKKECVLPRITTAILVAVLLLICATIVNAAEERQDDGWHFAITPYIWLPTISGSMKLEPPPGVASGGLDYGPGNYLENLDFVAMLDFQMRKGKLSLLADILYTDFSDNETARFPGALPGGGEWTAGAGWELQALVLQFAGAYSVFQDGRSNFDLLGGVRYASIEGDVSLELDGPLPGRVRSRTFSDTVSYVDPIVGFNGNFELGKKWYLPYYFDIGGFSVSSDLTLQAYAGIGYHFNDWFSTVLGYRYLYYDFGDGGELVEDLSLYGASLAFTFTF